MNGLVPSLTLRSHGARVARFHIYDWIILLGLMVTDGLLNLIEPFHRFVGRDMMTDLRYPMKGNTVPFWAVPVHISIFFPNLTDQQKLPNVCFTCTVVLYL
jgi:diacylglycerol diphosphate phosphatase / phosphatidate phosphatase